MNVQNNGIPVLHGIRVGKQIRVWCKYCNKYHYHGFPEGHRVAHCINKNSHYIKTGYIIVVDDAAE